MEMAQHLPSELSSLMVSPTTYLLAFRQHVHTYTSSLTLHLAALQISKTIESGYDEPLNGLDAEVLTDPDNQAVRVLLMITPF